MRKNWKTYYSRLLTLLMLAGGLVSCEMKNELWGKEPGEVTSDKVGLLDLKVEVKAPVFSGLSDEPDAPAIVVPDVNDFIVKIFDRSMALKEQFDSYSDYLSQKDRLMEAGEYSVDVYSGEDYVITAGKPYYAASKDFQIHDKEVTSVNLVCEMQSAIIYIVPGMEFLNACQGDYAITITNGTGVLSIGKDDSPLVYVRPGLEVKVTIRATEKETGTPVARTFALSDSDGKVHSRDLFKIEIKDLEEDIVPEKPEQPEQPDVPEEPTNGKFTIKVDVTLNENPIDIIVPSGGGSGSVPGGNDGDNSGNDTDEAVVFTGDAINTDLVVTAPAGIESFKVTIDSPLLPADELVGIGLRGNFDLASPGDLSAGLKGLGFPVGDEVKGKTQVSFNISTFVPLLEGLGSGTSKFILTVTDTKGNSESKTITVTT